MELPLLDLFLVLLAALAAGRIALRFGFPSVLGELAIGILLGPPVLGLLSGNAALDLLAQVGVILMMLYIGMEIDPAEMKKASTGGFLAAIGGFVTPFVLCYWVVTATGGTPIAGVFVGMAAGVTSLATKSRILADLRLLDTRIAHVMMAGALIADTLSLLVFAGIIGVAEAGSLQLDDISLTFGKAVAFFVLAFAGGRFLVPLIGRLLVGAGRGPAFTVVILIGLAYAEAAHLAGLHGILGAFVAGLFLRDSVIGRTLKQEVMDLVRDASVRFLAPIFFVTAGFAVSFNVVTESPGLLLAVIGLASAGKVVGTALFYLPTGHGWREGLVIGASMNGRGAVEIIVAQIGLTMGLISQDIFSILVFMAIITTATVPVFLKLGAEWLGRRGELTRTVSDREGTLIIGAGPLARSLASVIPMATLVDRNPAHCAAAEAAGLRVVRGNALDERVLAEAGASEARSFVPLTGNAEVDVLAARLARDTFVIPDIFLPAYAKNSAHAEAVEYLGARTLFATSFSPRVWDYRIENGATEIGTHHMAESAEAEQVAMRLGKAGAVLILSLDRDGQVEPFHGGTTVESDCGLTIVRGVQSEPQSELARLIAEAPVVDLKGGSDLNEFFRVVADALAPLVNERPEALATWMSEREHMSSTVLERGIAVPHVRLEGRDKMALLLARSATGIQFPAAPEPVHAAFVLATSDDRRREHLRILALIARMISAEGFLSSWLSAPDLETVRRLVAERQNPYHNVN